MKLYFRLFAQLRANKNLPGKSTFITSFTSKILSMCKISEKTKVKIPGKTGYSRTQGRMDKHQLIRPSFPRFNNERGLRGNSFTTYGKSSIKLTFLPLDTHTYVYVPEGKKCQFFGRFCVLTK